ncbi:hypothetical protein IE53DRAFT_76510 [Violaceomyces palustris]|uniref:Uncharacterized protein n=1 Tax=Violaceomyces palustris TaxID=1673888 RepID=A0ACD0P7M4_9BASI|nr:hypothetical protein IE53DRAFT_76510 [Violaceomyces palustris]
MGDENGPFSLLSSPSPRLNPSPPYHKPGPPPLQPSLFLSFPPLPRPDLLDPRSALSQLSHHLLFHKTLASLSLSPLSPPPWPSV